MIPIFIPIDPKHDITVGDLMDIRGVGRVLKLWAIIMLFTISSTYGLLGWQKGFDAWGLIGVSIMLGAIIAIPLAFIYDLLVEPKEKKNE